MVRDPKKYPLLPYMGHVPEGFEKTGTSVVWGCVGDSLEEGESGGVEAWVEAGVKEA